VSRTVTVVFVIAIFVIVWLVWRARR